MSGRICHKWGEGMTLTPKQERYCINRAIKKMSQRKAYLDAYPRAEKWKPKTVDEEACRIEKESKISARIKELQEEEKEQIQREAKWTREDAFDALKWMLDKAREEVEGKGEFSSPCVSAITNAVKELNEIFEVTAEKGETANDGFIEALNGQAVEVWNDEENGDIPV